MATQPQPGQVASRSTTLNLAHVSGFPPFTKAPDLERVLSKVGPVKVNRFVRSGALVSFQQAGDVQRATGFTTLNVYGSFLKIVPYDPTKHDQPATNNNKANNFIGRPDTFVRSKQKDTSIIPAEQVNLTGEFHEQLQTLLAHIRLTRDEVEALSALYSDLENALQSVWPGCLALPFGSITTGLGIKSSDADCFIQLPSSIENRRHAVVRAKRVLEHYPKHFTEIYAIPGANTPIVKFFHIPTGTNCDVSFKTQLGVRNSKLIKFLLLSDPRLIPMSVLLKYWAKVHNLSGTGRLSNYTLTMLIIFYLQQPHIGILPSIAWLQQDLRDENWTDFWNTGFMSDEKQLPKVTNTSSISELLGGFFTFYSKFNFDELVVCPYTGEAMKKNIFKDPNTLPAEFDLYKMNVLEEFVYPMRCRTMMCVQDPFEQCHNVATCISYSLALELQAYFKFAAEAYQKDKDNQCKDFLSIILRKKPNLDFLNKKAIPDFRSTVWPKILDTLPANRWKEISKQILMKLFEDILCLDLKKDETPVNPEPQRKPRDKYVAVAKKKTWKRKTLHYTTLQSIKCTFLEQQLAVNEEIFKHEKDNLNLKMQLHLRYLDSSRKVLVDLKYVSGDIEDYKEFGRFILGNLNVYFTKLVKCDSDFTEVDCKPSSSEACNVSESERKQETSKDNVEEPGEALCDTNVQNITDKIKDLLSNYIDNKNVSCDVTETTEAINN